MIADSNPLPLCVRVNVAAQMIGIGRTKFYQLISDGEVEVIKVGNATLITTASLSAFVERQRLQH
jgi:excisionase family DNA binding protein